VWQLTAHYLGVQHQYIPAAWADAELQSDLTLDPVLGSTPEGVALAETLVSLASDAAMKLDLGLSRSLLSSLARYIVGTNKAGDRIADMLELDRNMLLDGSIKNGWPWFVALREAGAKLPGSNKLLWSFDEVLRLGVLWGTSGGFGPIHIEMATANRSDASYTHTY
jgi:hypothetical protein